MKASLYDFRITCFSTFPVPCWMYDIKITSQLFSRTDFRPSKDSRCTTATHGPWLVAADCFSVDNLCFTDLMRRNQFSNYFTALIAWITFFFIDLVSELYSVLTSTIFAACFDCVSYFWNELH